VDTVLESATSFHHESCGGGGRVETGKAESRVLMLQGAHLPRQAIVGLILNVRREDLDRVVGILPALKKPTISMLSDPEWVAVNTIVEESVVRQILPKLKAANAQGIVEYP